MTAVMPVEEMLSVPEVLVLLPDELDMLINLSEDVIVLFTGHSTVQTVDAPHHVIQ